MPLEEEKMTVGEFYKRLVVDPPREYADLYQLVKDLLLLSLHDFPKPVMRWGGWGDNFAMGKYYTKTSIDEWVEKWFGTSIETTIKCWRCGKSLTEDDLVQKIYACPSCGIYVPNSIRVVNKPQKPPREDVCVYTHPKEEHCTGHCYEYTCPYYPSFPKS